MRITIDANRLFSALLRDGPTRKAIFETDAVLFAPQFMRKEFDRHRAELLKRSQMAEADFARLVDRVGMRIVWVSDSEIEPHLHAADRALGAVDKNDVPYLACALATKADAIWSHDLDFDRQTLVPRVPHPNARVQQGSG